MDVLLSWMRHALSVIVFALLFWLIFVFTVGTFIFLGGAGHSNPLGDSFGLLFLLPLVAGGIYGWYRSRRTS
jgi:Domain of unknown function (DUF202)